MTQLPSLVPPRFRNLVSRPWTDIEDLFSDLIPSFKSDALGKGTFALDVEEKDDKYIVEAELPGVVKGNLDVTLEDKLLTIKVNDAGESEKKGRNFVRKERWEGSASRSIMLPFAADSDGVEANLKDGVLKINVKKQAPSKTKKIAVQ